MTPQETCDTANLIYCTWKKTPADLFRSLENLYAAKVLGDGSLTRPEFEAILTGDFRNFHESGYGPAARVISQRQAFARLFPNLLEKLDIWEHARQIQSAVEPFVDIGMDEILDRDYNSMHQFFTVQMPQMHRVRCYCDWENGRYMLYSNKTDRPMLEITRLDNPVYVPEADSFLFPVDIYPTLINSRYNRANSLQALLKETVSELGHYTAIIESLVYHNKSPIISETLFRGETSGIRGLKIGPPRIGDKSSPHGALLITFPLYDPTNDTTQIEGWYAPPEVLRFIADNKMFTEITLAV